MKKTLAQKKTERCEKKNEKLFLFTVMSLNTLEKKKTTSATNATN